MESLNIVYTVRPHLIKMKIICTRKSNFSLGAFRVIRILHPEARCEASTLVGVLSV